MIKVDELVDGMRILLVLAAFSVSVTADVSHIYASPFSTYGSPRTSYDVPSDSVTGSAKFFQTSPTSPSPYFNVPISDAGDFNRFTYPRLGLSQRFQGLGLPSPLVEVNGRVETSLGSSNVGPLGSENLGAGNVAGTVQSGLGQETKFLGFNGANFNPTLDQTAGGWHILRNWNEEDFDMNKLLQKLHEKFGVSPFFKISVGPNPNSPGHNAIRISPAGLGLPDREYYYMDEEERIQVAYKEFIRDVIIYLSTTRNQATKFSTDIFSYEKRIAEITPDTKNLQNPITTYNAISLSELKATNLIPFFDIVQSMYPDTNITDSTEVIVTSLDYLGHIAQIISTTDRKTMNGYLIWTLVREYIPYLSNTFTSTVDTFKSELYGFQQPMERWEICSNLVRKFMGYATEVLQTKLSPVTEEDQEVIREIFNSIVNVVNEKIEGLKKSVLLYNHLKSKLQHLRLQIGLPEQFKKDNFLKEYYTPLMILKANFFDSIVHTVKFQRKIEQAMLNKRPTEEIQQWFTSGEEEPVVQYSPSDHAIIIPRSLLTEPLFNCNYSSSVLYGRLGVEISEAVVSSILPYGSLWTSDRKILSPYHTTVNDSIKSVRKLTKCMADLNLNLEVKLRTANETALKMAVHLTGVDVAKEALLLHLQKVEHAEHVHQPSLEEYEEPALFFLTYAQTQCSKSTSQYRLYNNIVNFELPQDARLHIIWSQIEDFSKSLDCSHNKKLQCPKIF